MQDENTMGKVQFVIEHIIWALMAMLWYKNSLFCCIPNISFGKSKMILWLMILAFSIIGICLRSKKNRNDSGVMVDLLIPYGLYTVITYIRVKKQMIVIVLGIVIILFVMYAFLVLGQKIKNRRYYKRVILRRVKRVVLAAQTMSAIGFAVIIFSFGMNLFFHSTVIKPSVETANYNTADEYTVSNYIDTVLWLQEELWKDLSAQEKMDVLQTIANIEQRYLGISNELNVGTANLKENLLAYYNDNTHEIVISMNYLLSESPQKVLNSLCHEVYHSYQHRVVDAYNHADEKNKSLRIFGNANAYAKEFADYVDGSEDFTTYYGQNCERDARNYAEYAVHDYYKRIEEHLKGE